MQSVKENEEAFIKCMVTGDPEPSVSWYYNGQPLNCKINLNCGQSLENNLLIFLLLLVDDQKHVKLADGLSIKHVAKNDSGEYTCKAFQISSALSNVKEQTIRLNIQRMFCHIKNYLFIDFKIVVVIFIYF